MKKIIIDTDTASDDAVALVMALREPTLQVLAITTVAGNVELPLAVKNALLSVERAGSYRPPVHVGAPGPLLCKPPVHVPVYHNFPFSFFTDSHNSSFYENTSGLTPH